MRGEQKPLSRVGTRDVPYTRSDGVSTIRFNFVCSKELYERERQFAVTHQFPMTRNKWLEQVITAALDAAEASDAERQGLIAEKQEQLDELETMTAQLKKELAELKGLVDD